MFFAPQPLSLRRGGKRWDVVGSTGARTFLSMKKTVLSVQGVEVNIL